MIDIRYNHTSYRASEMEAVTSAASDFVERVDWSGIRG